ncbi:MAG: 4a-hydroxytetrahydrobiopterin dehydratase [Clostridia bacterium]
MTKLTLDQVKFNLGKVPGWKLSDDQKALMQTFACNDFAKAIEFVNRVASYLEHDHDHAELRIASGWVTVLLSSKAVNGLTGKDFAIAQAINKMKW